MKTVEGKSKATFCLVSPQSSLTASLMRLVFLTQPVSQMRKGRFNKKKPLALYHQQAVDRSGILSQTYLQISLFPQGQAR